MQIATWDASVGYFFLFACSNEKTGFPWKSGLRKVPAGSDQRKGLGCPLDNLQVVQQPAFGDARFQSTAQRPSIIEDEIEFLSFGVNVR